MIEKVKKNKNFILGIIVGIIITATTGVVAYSVYANTVTYDNTQSGLQSTDVQGAIDELYVKAKTWINPIQLNNFGYYMNTSHVVLANSEGIYIKRNGTVYYFGINNWSYEKDHIRQAFSNASCNTTSSLVICTDSNFRCSVSSDGNVRCRDESDDSYCRVTSDGTVECT